MHLQVYVIAFMLAMTPVVLSNPLAQPIGIHLYTLEGKTNSFAKRSRLGSRQVPGYPFMARFVEDHRAARSTASIPSHETLTKTYAKPELTEVHTATGPLVFPVGKESPGQDTAGSHTGSQSISSSQPESIPSLSSSAGLEANKNTHKMVSRLNSPPGTAMSWFHRDTTKGLPGSSGMLSSQQETATSTPTPAESEARKDILRKLKRLKSPPRTAVNWRYWTRRQVPTDMEENNPSAFLAAHQNRDDPGASWSIPSLQSSASGSRRASAAAEASLRPGQQAPAVSRSVADRPPPGAQRAGL